MLIDKALYNCYNINRGNLLINKLTVRGQFHSDRYIETPDYMPYKNCNLN